MKKLLAIVLAGVVFASCIKYSDYSIIDIKDPQTTDIASGGMLPKFGLNAIAVIDNKAKKDLIVKNLNFYLAKKGEKNTFFIISSQGDITVPANSTSDVPLNMTARFTSLMSVFSAQSAMEDPSQMEVRISATLTSGKSVKKVTYKKPLDKFLEMCGVDEESIDSLFD